MLDVIRSAFSVLLVVVTTLMHGPAEARQASAELASWFREELARAAAADEEPSYELLERAVDGELEPEEAESLRQRAEWDGALRRELDELGQRVPPDPAVRPAGHSRFVRRQRPRARHANTGADYAYVMIM